MFPDPLDLLWRCVDVELPVFAGDEAAAWPPGMLATLRKLDLICGGKTASYITCDACTEGHVEKVMRIPYPDGRIRFFIACPEHGRVEVEPERLRQWAVRFDPICRFLADQLGIQAGPEEIVPSRIWKIGRTSLAGRSRVVWMGRGLSSPEAETLSGVLPKGATPVLFLLGRPPRDGLLKLKPDSLIDLAQVLSLSDDRLVLDKAAVEDQLSATGEVPRKRPPVKRASRTAAIDALERALIDHIIAARDHAYAEERRGRSPKLLPRPAQKQLAAQLKLSRAAVSRAFSDGNAQKLKMLWEMAGDLGQVMDYPGR